MRSPHERHLNPAASDESFVERAVDVALNARHSCLTSLDAGSQRLRTDRRIAPVLLVSPKNLRQFVKITKSGLSNPDSVMGCYAMYEMVFVLRGCCDYFSRSRCHQPVAMAPKATSSGVSFVVLWH